MYWLHASSPVFSFRAITCASASPANTSPSPRATPSLDGEPWGAAGAGRPYCHTLSPVLAFSAYTDAPAVTNITPSFTTGVARDVPASNFGEVQAPPRRATVCVLIRFSVE